MASGRDFSMDEAAGTQDHDPSRPIFDLDISLQKNMENVGLTIKNTFIDLQPKSSLGDPPTASAPANMGAGGWQRLVRKPSPPTDSVLRGKSEHEMDVGSRPDDQPPGLTLAGHGSPMQVLPEAVAEEAMYSEHLPPASQQPSISAGSAMHGTGSCSPCAWFWRPGGCSKGDQCTRCHECPEGELKRRKKAKSVSSVTSSRNDSPIRRASLASSTGEPAYVVCSSSDTPVTLDCDYSVQSIFPTKVTVGDVKNTFINFNTKAEPLNEPPTVSAPGAMMSRLFKTRAPIGTGRPPTPTYSGGPPTCSRSSNYSMASANSVDSTMTADIFGPYGVPDFPPGVLDQPAWPPGEFSPRVLEPPGLLEPPAAASRSGIDAGVDVETDSQMYITHAAATCMPCNYFYYKADGCRQGSECQFCHLCPKGEIKRRKKERVKMLKAQNATNEGLPSFAVEAF